MLQALEGIDAKRARIVLASASQRVIPPGFRSAPSNPIAEDDERVVNAVLSELRRRASRTKTGPDEEGLILDALSRETSEFVLPDIEKDGVKKRLGEDGRLPTSLYNITFSPKFIANVPLWCVTKTHVQNAIKESFQVQHLMAVTEGPRPTPHATLFVHWPQVKGDQYVVFVKADRLGDELNVDDAFRIYLQEIPIQPSDLPIQVLSKFLEKFGLHTHILLDVAGRKEKLSESFLFENAVFKVPAKAALIISSNSNQEARFTNPLDEDTDMEICLSYSISNRAYFEQVTRHGVRSEMTGPSFSMAHRNRA